MIVRAASSNCCISFLCSDWDRMHACVSGWNLACGLTAACLFGPYSNPSTTPCAAPPWPGWVATGAAERTDESSPTTSPRPFRRCPVWATPPAWDWVPPACNHHVAVLAARNRQGGAEEEHKTLKTSKIMAVRFDPYILLAVNTPNLNKT